MSNVAGKTYGMNVLTPMPVGRTWINRLLFMVARVFPKVLSGLLGLKLIHFARWVIIRRDQWPPGTDGRQRLRHDYMLFCSNFNGTWDQYIDAFSDGLPSGLDLFWYASVKYPHSIPITPFKDYIVHNQFDTDYYYNATPGAAQRDIKAALAVKAAIARLGAVHAIMNTTNFATLFRKELIGVQMCLGSQGYAPVASVDTLLADMHREPYVSGEAAAR